MKIVTWNLDKSNRDQVGAINFLLGLGIDVACLQELRFETVRYLQSLQQFQMASCVSYFQNEVPVFSAIISKVSIENAEVHRFQTLHSSFLARVSQRNLRRNYYQFFDFLVGDKTFRIFNLHLPSVVSPSYRNILLNQVLKQLHTNVNIVCGDFNSFGHFPWNIAIGLLSGAEWKDYIRNELTVLKTISEQNNLKLSTSFSVTYPRYKTKIDHIMIPNFWEEFTSSVFEDCYGSDHRLVLLEETETSKDLIIASTAIRQKRISTPAKSLTYAFERNGI